MRLRHFETLRPVCPVCRKGPDVAFPLSIAHAARERSGEIVEAILHCTNAGCQREYPLVEGIPLLIGNLRQFVVENALRLLSRTDLSAPLETLIGDCSGPGSGFDAVPAGTLHSLLTPGGSVSGVEGLTIAAERDDLPGTFACTTALS